MSFLTSLQAYLYPGKGVAEYALGEWSDDLDGEKDKSYLSISFQNSERPGVISQTRIVELFVVSPAQAHIRPGGRVSAFESAEKLIQYIIGKPVSSCFANVIPIAGIIGPKVTADKRHVYMIPLAITF